MPSLLKAPHRVDSPRCFCLILAGALAMTPVALARDGEVVTRLASVEGQITRLRQLGEQRSQAIQAAEEQLRNLAADHKRQRDKLANERNSLFMQLRQADTRGASLQAQRDKLPITNPNKAQLQAQVSQVFALRTSLNQQVQAKDGEIANIGRSFATNQNRLRSVVGTARSRAVEIDRQLSGLETERSRLQRELLAIQEQQRQRLAEDRRQSMAALKAEEAQRHEQQLAEARLRAEEEDRRRREQDIEEARQRAAAGAAERMQREGEDEDRRRRKQGEQEQGEAEARAERDREETQRRDVDRRSREETARLRERAALVEKELEAARKAASDESARARLAELQRELVQIKSDSARVEREARERAERDRQARTERDAAEAKALAANRRPERDEAAPGWGKALLAGLGVVAMLGLGFAGLVHMICRTPRELDNDRWDVTPAALPVVEVVVVKRPTARASVAVPPPLPRKLLGRKG
jgi:hypothetical protein